MANSTYDKDAFEVLGFKRVGRVRCPEYGCAYARCVRFSVRKVFWAVRKVHRPEVQARAYSNTEAIAFQDDFLCQLSFVPPLERDPNLANFDP